MLGILAAAGGILHEGLVNFAIFAVATFMINALCRCQNKS
jgi:hypothetical protein